MVEDWRAFLTVEIALSEEKLIKLHERTGRPLGENSFVKKLKKILNLKLMKSKPGPKSKKKYN